MAYKLGTSKQLYAVGGEIKGKLSFKNSPRDMDGLSVPGNPIIRMPLEEGVFAEANGPNHDEHPNSIYINEKVDINTPMAEFALNHEMRHLTAMKISPNKLSYTDDSVTYEGDVYPRKDRYGKDMIQDIHTGEWKESGHPEWPWERDANMGDPIV